MMLQFTRRLFSNLSQSKIAFNTSTLEGRYSCALYSATLKQGNFEKMAKDISSFRNQLKADQKLMGFLENPSIEKATKIKAMVELLQKHGMDQLLVNFVSVIGTNGRVNKLVPILEAFEDLVRQQRGDASVTLTSVAGLSSKQVSKIISGLEEKFPELKKAAEVKQKSDPRVLGGFIIEIGDKTIDMSVASRVRKLNESLYQSI